jgi:hypothetical protein
MSTKDKIYSLIDVLNESDLELMLLMLERFAGEKNIPNDETIKALKESDYIASNPDIKGYTSVDELMEALDS